VLTAAHCVNNKLATELKIRAGEWDTQTKRELYAHQDRDVSSFVMHEQFSKGSLANDIALVFLGQPVELTPSVATACLPPQNYNFENLRCTASGWGKDIFGKEGKYQVILKKIELPIVPNPQCQAAFRTTRLGVRFNLHESFICAGGEKGKDTCRGDGGSPLVCPISGTPDRYYQAGIVAWVR
jgi:secreted trypsin-like serine protease